MVALLGASDRSAQDLQSNASTSPEQSSSAYLDNNTAAHNEKAKEILDIFITKMAPLFPFIVIAAHISAEQLHREKPFLFLNISMVACQNPARQQEIVRKVEVYVAEHVVLRGEHSMDLLQGLLVHVAWFIAVPRMAHSHSSERPADKLNPEWNGHHYARSGSHIDVFLNLARAQIISLNLHQGIAALKSSDRPLSYLRLADLMPGQVLARTLEERRAYLGCYYISVM